MSHLFGALSVSGVIIMYNLLPAAPKDVKVSKVEEVKEKEKV